MGAKDGAAEAITATDKTRMLVTLATSLFRTSGFEEQEIFQQNITLRDILLQQIQLSLLLENSHGWHPLYKDIQGTYMLYSMTALVTIINTLMV
jgi:hypothetical protein